MKYGLIVCPRCGKARGVETVRKTVTCQCGRQIKVGRMKIQFLTDSPLELAKTVQKVNASLKGDGPMPKDRMKRGVRTITVDKEKMKGAKNQLERTRLIVEELSKKKPEFSSEDLSKISSQIGGGNADALVERLLASGVIYEVSPGRFRAA